ncbi:MAG TPA: hypothetical protein PLU72_11945 [Candidatus Ozemobacteraceae bacterium]|nr:hypothetical protein [Candidatus Ozemobacteraceae bacterium]HQG28791.1 hypothetical protein [Candidatus Ozemobacteraceae bacterium]
MPAGTYSGTYINIVLVAGLFLAPPGWGPLQPRCAAAESAGAGAFKGEVEIDILSQWTGTQSGYRERPNYFLVRSLPELQIFWEKHASGEPMPNVDFENRMLFLWVSGPSLSGFHVVKAVRVVRNGQRYILELDLRRSDAAGAGSWRNPWLMALLPKFRGDIEVVRRGDATAGEAERMPLATIRDMGGGQAGMAAITKVSSGGGAAKTSSSVSGSGGVTKAPVNPPKAGATTPAQPVARPAETAGGKAAPDDGKGDASAAGQAPAATATAEPDPFGDAFNLDF